MAKFPREKPKHLPAKLKAIRLKMKLSQGEMLTALGLHDANYRSAVSGYELGTKEPSLPTLLKYARLAGVSTDDLIDDLTTLEPTV